MMVRMLMVSLAGLALMAATTFDDEIAQWRKQRLERLKADGGWLSVAGLSWLHEGSNTFGKGEGNDIAVPDGPAHGPIALLIEG